MEPNKRIQILSENILRVVEKEKDPNDAIMVICSCEEESLLFLGGENRKIFYGLLEAMHQNKSMADMILKLAEAFLHIKEEECAEKAVQDLIDKALGKRK